MSVADRRVSQHAFLRWLERFHGINMAAVCTEMIAAGHKKPISETELAKYLVKYRKITRQEIVKEIYTPLVAACLNQRAIVVRLPEPYRGYELKVIYTDYGEPIITTVTPINRTKAAKRLSTAAKKKRFECRKINRNDVW